MQILAIIGSPRGMQGNTGRLLEEVLAGAATSGATIEIVNLGALRLQPCVACDSCHVTGSCPLPDGFEAFKARLLSCDGFVLASPNYIFSVSAQMKICFDRLNGLIHCLALEGKYGAAVETSGGGEDAEVLAYMERFVNILGALSVGGIGSPMAGVRTFPEQDALFARARALGAELCRCIRTRQHFPGQEQHITAFRQRMAGLVDYMPHWVYEHDYWQRKRQAQAP